ncbi:MAG: hypothetical protein ACLS89_02965 [Collinsella sp.]
MPAVAVSGEIADDMLMVTPSDSSLDVTKDKTTVFQVCFTDPTMGASARSSWPRSTGCQDRLFYNSGDTYSSGVADACRAGQASKLDIVDTETLGRLFHELYQPAHQGQGSRRHAYLCPDHVHAGVRPAPRTPRTWATTTLMGTDGMDGLLSVEGFDTSLAEGTAPMTPFSADDEKNADFVRAIRMPTTRRLSSLPPTPTIVYAICRGHR